METKNYTIKDIARLAGVSAGTVDRVLHNRGDVSQASRVKVMEVLARINYQPNKFAIGLAAKKKYRMVCIVPYHTDDDYWHTVEAGIRRAAEEMRPFNVSVDFLHYLHANKISYQDACHRAMQTDLPTDGVLIAPNFHEETLSLTTYLDKQDIPYLFIDFNVEPAHALSYIGQDSRISGHISAKMLLRGYEPGEEMVLFMSNQKDNPAEIQMRRRIEGFIGYVSSIYPNIKVHDLVLHKEDEQANRQLLDNFFALHPQVTLGAVFNSRVYQVAGYLHESRKKMRRLVGYDLLQKNVDYLKSGEIDCLIGQRPGLQGYCGIQTLCNHVVFKKPVAPVKYMPIDILIKENIDFYFEFDS